MGNRTYTKYGHGFPMPDWERTYNNIQAIATDLSVPETLIDADRVWLHSESDSVYVLRTLDQEWRVYCWHDRWKVLKQKFEQLLNERQHPC